MNKKRVMWIYFLFLCTSLFLAFRLFVIAQNGSRATEALAGQYTRSMGVIKRNGFVFDRNGEKIDVVSDGFITLVDPAQLIYEKATELSELLSQSSTFAQSYFYEKILSEKPFVIKTNIRVEHERCASFEKYKENDSLFLHLLGYRNSDGVGMSGILKAYDAFLTKYSAADVKAVYRSDAKGRRAINTDIEIFDDGYSSAEGLYLTVDKKIQECVERICEKHIDIGAVVVQDTRTGEILAMVSAPLFDKNKLSEYLDSDRGELLNRSVLGYTPGSVFKSVIAVSALSDENFDPEKEYECVGYIEIDGQKIKCHNTSGHGKVNLKKAFAVSCNPYFINLGCNIGYEKIIETASSLGVGKYSSVNLLPCAKGVLPKHEDVGTVANISVGQGQILLSPLQVCSMISTLVTGEYHKPSLVKKTVADSFVTHYLELGEKTVLSDDMVDVMKELFESCVNDGTGYRAKSDMVQTAGKTATAQSGQIRDGKEVVHSWFAGYFPADIPQYTICVLCDGNSSENAHPSEIFRLIAEAICAL